MVIVTVVRVLACLPTSPQTSKFAIRYNYFAARESFSVVTPPSADCSVLITVMLRGADLTGKDVILLVPSGVNFEYFKLNSCHFAPARVLYHLRTAYIVTRCSFRFHDGILDDNRRCVVSNSSHFI